MRKIDLAKVLVVQAQYLASVSTIHNDFNFYGFLSLKSTYHQTCCRDDDTWLLLESFVQASIQHFFVGPLPPAVQHA